MNRHRSAVTVLVPYWDADPTRRYALRFVQNFYSSQFPAWRLVTANEASRGRVLTRWLERHSDGHEVVILNDADSLVPPKQLAAAVWMVGRGSAFVRAFTSYQRISRAGSAKYSGPGEVFDDPEVEWSMENSQSHGVVACRTSVLAECGYYDPRFAGWGYEDLALDVMVSCRWEQERVPGPLYHLWHEADPSGAPDSPTLAANEALYQRYLAAAGDWSALLALRAEADRPVAV